MNKNCAQMFRDIRMAMTLLIIWSVAKTSIEERNMAKMERSISKIHDDIEALNTHMELINRTNLAKNDDKK